jgi:hypothetical protein
MVLDLLVLLLLAALIGAVVVGLNRRRQLPPDHWRVRVRAVSAGTAVEIVRPGTAPLRVALLDPAQEDFSTLLEEARAAAMERTIALNSVHESLPP